MSIVVIDYGMGNLRSVRRALEEVGADCQISDRPADLDTAAGIVIPGVGAFSDGMRNLESSGMAEAIQRTTREDQVPVLGICLGMQLLATTGTEGGECAGLDLIPGRVYRLAATEGERVPHVGWNEVDVQRDDPLIEDLADNCDFYFVHSYAVCPDDPDDVIADSPYAGRFASVIGRGLVRGTQFHPERSSKPGFRILENFLTLCYR